MKCSSLEILKERNQVFTAIKGFLLACFIVQWLVLCDDFRIFCKTVRSTNVLASTLIWEEYGFSFVCVAGVPDVSVCTDWLRSEPTSLV